MAQKKTPTPPPQKPTRPLKEVRDNQRAERVTDTVPIPKPPAKKGSNP